MNVPVFSLLIVSFFSLVWAGTHTKGTSTRQVLPAQNSRRSFLDPFDLFGLGSSSTTYWSSSSSSSSSSSDDDGPSISINIQAKKNQLANLISNKVNNFAKVFGKVVAAAVPKLKPVLVPPPAPVIVRVPVPQPPSVVAVPKGHASVIKQNTIVAPGLPAGNAQMALNIQPGSGFLQQPASVVPPGGLHTKYPPTPIQQKNSVTSGGTVLTKPVNQQNYISGGFLSPVQDPNAMALGGAIGGSFGFSANMKRKLATPSKKAPNGQKRSARKQKTVSPGKTLISTVGNNNRKTHKQKYSDNNKNEKALKSTSGVAGTRRMVRRNNVRPYLYSRIYSLPRKLPLSFDPDTHLKFSYPSSDRHHQFRFPTYGS